MKKLSILLSIHFFILFNGCAPGCMEYRSATTAARSEKDLKRAEEWGLKALGSPACNPSTDAWTPYFLGTEVYLQQKKYAQMAEMLTLAEQRNPDQPLEKPFKLGDTPVETTREGVEAFRDQEWTKVYNKAVDYIKKDKIDKAKKKIEIAILIHPKKGENYSTLATIYIENENIDAALETANRGLGADYTNSLLYQIKADLLLHGDSLLASDPKLLNLALKKAEESLLKAIEYSDDPGPIMRKLLFVYIDMGDNQRAIDYSNELLDKYPNDADLYYNVGVLFQRLTVQMFDPTRKLFLSTTEESSPKTIRNVYNSFVTTRKYAYNSKDYFLQASDLESNVDLDKEELLLLFKSAKQGNDVSSYKLIKKYKLDIENYTLEEFEKILDQLGSKNVESTHQAVSEMDKLMDQIDEIFIPSIRETARSAGIELE